MALRTIRLEGDKVLEKVCRPVTKMTPRIKTLIEDMFETMYDAYGVGLAAPQVGILKRICVIDVDGEHPFVFINPEIVEKDGEQTGEEGCLSIPGMVGLVTRPEHIIVKAFDENMEPFELEADGLLARACCHEFDHLDGHLYRKLAKGPLHRAGETEEQESPEEEETEEL
ncbi:peptide deformylase [Bilifractor porci]|uniref:Peptide deformylase n=1 Tax=Bilifractor porci TaxID=2606636 RepID=A0A7X2P9D5_9FIRM|nr:peptide deformylase [Bilifractor porci]MST82153.1 peptide deformylase [Bilifractor porci]